MVEAAAGRTEKERKIPADVLSAMHACGLFHMLLPVSLGGGAVDLVTFNLGPRDFANPGAIGLSRPSSKKTPVPSAFSLNTRWKPCGNVWKAHYVKFLARHRIREVFRP